MEELDLEPILEEVRELSDLNIIRLLAYIAAEVSDRARAAEARGEEELRLAHQAAAAIGAPWRQQDEVNKGKGKGKGKGKRPRPSRRGPY